MVLTLYYLFKKILDLILVKKDKRENLDLKNLFKFL